MNLFAFKSMLICTSFIKNLNKNQLVLYPELIFFPLQVLHDCIDICIIVVLF